MKVISFLGINRYERTFYTWQDQEYETEFFAEAVAHFLKPEEMLVCVTPTVREGQKSGNWTELQKRFDALSVAYKGIKIPEGRSDKELWEIFDVMTDAVQEGETVVFDLTNSFRSLPFLSFLAIAYLRAARNVKVDHVLYGAWDARNQENRSPVFDLTPFVALLDWTTATNRFVETGDGRALTQLLKMGMPSGVQMGQDLEMRLLGNNLKLAANTIQTISLALQVTRPIEVMESAAHLSSTFEQTLPAIAENARPFAVLAESVVEQYGQFGLEGAGETQNIVENLRRQIKMIQWYLDHEQIVQASTLMREWIVSLLASKLNESRFDYEENRRLIEKTLNNAVELSRPNHRKVETSPFDEGFKKMPEHAMIYKLWGKITDVRNDIAHVGMRIAPQTAIQLEQKVKAFMPQLEKLMDVLLSNV